MYLFPDPNDFADTDEPEGEEGINTNPQAGKPDVGGLSTDDAEDAYQRAAEEHFRDDTHTNQTSPTSSKEEKQKDENAPTLPEIGSIEESDQQSYD